MKYRYLKICCLLVSCFFTNACATYLTIVAPPIKEVALGEDRATGRMISTDYQLVEGAKEFTLLKKSFCMETAKERIISKKRLHGVIPALIEIPLFGLGLVDLVAARQYSKQATKEKEGQVVETGSIVECGDFKPAANVELVIQCPKTGQIAYVTTGASGEVAINNLFAGFLLNSQLNIFVREDRCFAYVSTLSSSFN